MSLSKVAQPETGLEIAIIGVSLRFPGARDVDTFWLNLCDGIESISRFDESTLDVSVMDTILPGDPAHVKAGGILDGIDLFDAAFFGFAPRDAQITDPQHRLFLECAWEAIESAGYNAAAYPGAIGVYASAGSNTYLLNNLCSNPDVLTAVGSLQIAIGNEKDYLATRTSYKLDLRGPSMSVQSACSSSLLAVHTACQALLNGECDMALAGGVSIAVPQSTGYRYHQGGIGSPDGHCRVFDAHAQGTVKGNGLGIVLLKRLADAVRDGDTIVAVIKGSAANNDGSAKVSYTAPSAAGQADVIVAAQTIAGVDPATVGFVEAHGTGTALGDPIEIAALTSAFGAVRAGEERCAVGSVKSNLGHLDAAAGIAGLLKAALAVKHGRIPATLHYTRANPNIDFETSPFAVGSAIAPWPKREGARRAGVSSFGIGGTNVHLVLEEAPAERPETPRSGDHLVLLSARSPAALDAASDRLAAHLAAHPELPLADVAYTLQVGRKAFDHRRSLVGSTCAEIAATLAARPSRRVYTGTKKATPLPIAFLFPGQGAQHVRMAAGLYANEPRFAAQLRACADILEPHLGLNLCELLYPDAAGEADAAMALRRTALTQPALFAVEYSLAHLWSEWGVEPRAMIGHSVGEFVAACRAGVFKLEDALGLVALRGKLMQQCTEGAMLAVPLPEADVRAYLDADLALAAVNRRSLCVVSGTNAAIDDLACRLEARTIAVRRLDVSHAFHSPMMDPILAAFVAAVDKVARRAPTIPFLSNVSGGWITADDAMDPGYWGRQLRQPVRFATCIETVLGEANWAFLEVGPGHTLGSAVRSFVTERSGCVVLQSLPAAGAVEADLSRIQETAGRLWCHGIDIRRDRLSSGRRCRIPLPTYPFERRRHWIEARARATSDVRPIEAQDALEVASPTRSDPSGECAVILSDTEAVIAALWRDVLGVAAIDGESHFFELGGDSIAGLQMTFQARQRGLHITLGQLLEHPTVSALAVVAGLAADVSAIDGEAPADGEGALPVIVAQPAERGEPFPLTAVQQAYWIGRSGAKELGTVAAHVYQEYQSADLDLAKLGHALDTLIRRHEALRSVTTADGRQRILGDVPAYHVAVHDLRGHSTEAVMVERSALRERMSHQVLPSERWPLFEVVASRCDGDIRLHLSIDILFTDAWSLVVMGRELIDLYRDPTLVLAPLALSFRDYVLAEVAMHDGALHRQSRRYWMERLEALPPAPALPLAARMRDVGQPRFVRRSGRLDADSWAAIKRRAGTVGLTPSMVLCAAYAEILAVWSASPRFCLNLPLFNRLPLHPDVNRILGDFTSVVLLEVDMSGSDPFERRAQRLQSRLWSDLDHRHFSGVDVMRELGRLDMSRAQMPVVFTSLILPGAQDSSAEAAATLGEAIFSISQTPQVHLDHQVAEDGDGLLFNWDSVDDAFPPELIAHMFDVYCRFLSALASDDAAWRGPARHQVRLPAAQVEAWTAFNATQGAGSSALLHVGFYQQAQRAPGRPAIITPTRTLSYGDLAACSLRIAQRLRDLGCGRGMLVAVVMEKGWEQVAAVLATLLVEAVYVPIDAGFPADYLHQVLAEAQVGVILTQPWLDTDLVWPQTIVRLALRDDDLVKGAIPPPVSPIATPGSPDDLAYIIYTSGTTGTPKGVMIDHRGAVNTILDVNARFGIGPDDRVFALSALNFDLSVYDVFGTLAAGAAMVLPAASGTRDPIHWAEVMRRAGVTVWNSVPALMEMLVQSLDGRDAGALHHMRLVMLSGDWIPVRLPARIVALAPAARLVSLGGATEASIWSILYDITTVDPAWTSIPYGRPMLNQRFLVLDDAFEPRPLHVPGALFIGGLGLAKGYWRNPGETEARFVLHPTSGERLYRTGDLGRLLPDGMIEFLGREDFQVKIQGYRIELGEIEAVFCRHGAVQAAAVIAGNTSGGGKRLIAYVVFHPGHAISVEALRDAARARLPDYMVPAVVVVLDALPMTTNGKIDRRALPVPSGETASEVMLPPRTATELRLSTIWCQILDQSTIGIDRNFFEIGGDSLLATKMMVAIHTAFDRELPLRTIFDLATIEALAQELDRLAEPGRLGATRPIPRVDRTQPLPVSASQGRLWFNDRLDPGNATYNFPVALRLTGRLQVDILERCLDEIVRRHDVLRTSFAVVDGHPVQIIAADQAVRVMRENVERLDATGQAAAIETAIAEETLFAFDLTRGPMFRARLLILSADAQILI
jgi:amino acid adenylation domain-containing protein